MPSRIRTLGLRCVPQAHTYVRTDCFSSTTAARASSSSSRSHAKGLNLTPFVSPLLLRLHPDTLQRHSVALALDNERAMKELNQFLELASAGCNNDTYRARKQVIGMAVARADDVNAPIRFPLRFHIPSDLISKQQRAATATTVAAAINATTTDSNSDSAAPAAVAFTPVSYVIEVPGVLVRRTLASPARASSRPQDPSAALYAPFAREWQRTTQRILQDLFQVAAIPLTTTTTHSDASEVVETPTQLARWIAETSSDAFDAQQPHSVRAAAHNRTTQRAHEAFDSVFHEMLTREKNIVFESTTGMEDGPTAQHAVLTSLLSERVCLPKLQTIAERQAVFYWLANFLLLHFMELRLHSLVWNKITLLVTVDADVTTPQVLWDDTQPENGMGVLIPAGIDADVLVDLLYEHVDALDAALNRKRHVQRATTATAKKKTDAQESGDNHQRKKSHFYAREVATMFRKR